MSTSNLAEFFVTAATYEHEVESVRHQLAIIPGFEPYCSFKRIDRRSKGYITAADLQDFLSSAGLTVYEDRLQAVIDQYNYTNSGRLSLHEFTQAVLPMTSPVVRDKVLSRPAFAYLAKEAELTLQSLFLKELEVIGYFSSVRDELLTQADKVYRTLSPSRLPVDARQIYEYLVRKAYKVTTEDVDALVRRLDRNQDSLVSFEDFTKVLTGSTSRNTRRSIGTELKQAFPTGSPISSKSTTAVSPDPKYNSEQYTSPPRQNLDLSVDDLPSPDISPSKHKTLQTTPLKLSRTRLDKTPPKTRYLSSLSADCSEVLYQSLCEQLHILESLERSKQQLAQRPDFNPHDVFKLFDVDNKGQVSALELEDTLDRLGVRFYRDEVYMLLRSYGRQRDGVLKYRDFLRMLSPREESKFTENLTGTQTHTLVCEHLRKLLEAELLFESLRQRLSDSRGYSNHSAFQKIDLDRDGYISSAELEAFTGKHEGLSILFEKLDKDRDGRVSFADFVDEWTPRTTRPM